MISPIEMRLRQIVGHIEKSSLDINEKNNIYKLIRDELKTALLPVFLNYIPQNRFEELDKNTDKLTIDSYFALLNEIVDNNGCYNEMTAVIGSVLDTTERVLKEKMIIV